VATPKRARGRQRHAAHMYRPGGTFAGPSDFSMHRYTFNSGGRIVVSGDTSATAEMLAEIRGSS
jgi:hypothetical protein